MSFNAPPTDKVTWRWGHGFKYHNTVDRNCDPLFTTLHHCGSDDKMFENVEGRADDG